MAAEYRDQVVVITGGSSGIGFALANRFVQDGAHVWILARNPDRLSEAIHQLENKRGTPDQCIGQIPVDVQNFDQVQKAIATITAQTGTPDLLINSAGYSHPGYVENLDLDIFRQTMEINYFGTVNSTKAVLPGMLEKCSGQIVNISSMAGLLGIFGYTAYGASKYAVRGFSDVLRAEMKPHGIRVSIVYPPDTDTPQLAYEDQFKPFETREIAGNSGVMKAEAVADVIIKGIKRGKYMIIPGFEGNLIYHASNLVGTLVYPVMDLLVSMAQKKNYKLNGNGNGKPHS